MGSKIVGVVPWDGGGATSNSLCIQASLAPVPSGVIPTVVIATTLDSCQDTGGKYKGIVFYDDDPQAWYCLAPDQVNEFKTWAATTFASVQIVMPAQPLAITCPPPPLRVAEVPRLDPRKAKDRPNDKLKARMRAKIKKELREMAKLWFVPPRSLQDKKKRVA